MAKLWLGHHKSQSRLHLPSQGMFRGSQEKSLLHFALTGLLWGPRVFFPILPRGDLLLSALLSLHETLLLVARGLDLRVGGVVGVVAESHCWPVVRSPLWGHGGQSQQAWPHSPGTPPPHTHPGTVLSTETLFTRALGAYCEPGGVQTPPQKPPPAVIRPLLGARGIWKEVILPLTAGTAGHR